MNTLRPLHRPGLTIVIPAYNEERRLPRTLAALRDYQEHCECALEVLVVDDGSTDGTAALVQREAGTMAGLHILARPHQGKGAAVRAGMLAATQPLVMLCDADLSMPVEQLDRFRTALELGAQVAVGSRELPESHRYREPALRHLMGRVFNLLVRLLVVQGLNDTQCGFKGFQRDVAYRLFSLQRMRGFSFDAEILFLARRYRLRVEEVPIDWHFDADSRVRPGVDTVRMTIDLLHIRLNDLRGDYGLRAGAFVAQEP
jgi:dolichyl-phosphate beta-glucosyltransferase